MKSSAFEVMGTQLGKVSSSSTIFCVSSSVQMFQGMLPTMSSQVIRPMPQVSMCLEQVSPLITSGAMQRGVPHFYVCSPLREQTAQPKSQILTTPSWMRMFSGLMSRWMMLRSLRYFSPCTSCLRQQAVLLSEILLRRTTKSKSCPPVHNSCITQMFSASSKYPQICTTLGCPKKVWILSYFTSCSSILCCLMNSLLSIFKAQRNPVLRCRVTNTSPNIPFPSLLPLTK